MNNLPTKPELITEELVKANYQIEATRLNYQAVLQNIENITFTRENINDPDPLIIGREILKALTRKKDVDKKPFMEPANKIQAEYNSLYTPLKEAIDRKTEEKKKVAVQVEKDANIVGTEKSRVNNIQSAITQFINQTAEDICNCNLDSEIVTIEKRIGSEGQKTTVYMEFANDLKERCKELKPLISQQKDFIRQLKRLDKIQSDEMDAGHDAKAIQAREEADLLRRALHENKIRIQEAAFKQAGDMDVMVAESDIQTPHAKRRYWKWRVDDIEMLNRRSPHLVVKVPNDQAIVELLKRHKEEGLLEGKTELNLNGLVFYLDKRY